MLTRPSAADFRARLRAGDLLLGTFVKTPHPAIVEVLARSPLDCVCLDAEHAPFDRSALDVGLLAARASDLPALVRIAGNGSSEVLNALDLGATGILVPHVASAEEARSVAAAARHGTGRGYAGSSRAAGYGTRTMRDIIAEANRTVTLIAQIEDRAALDHLDAIAAVGGIDALFIGRMDLTVSLGAQTPEDKQVVDAVRSVCSIARQHHMPVGMYTPTVEEARQWSAEGVSLFLLASDQQWVLQGARALVADFRRA